MKTTRPQNTGNIFIAGRKKTVGAKHTRNQFEVTNIAPRGISVKATKTINQFSVNTSFKEKGQNPRF